MTSAPTPSLLDALRADPLVQPYLKAACAENGIAASISPQIAPADVVIIAPDVYYNSPHGPKPTPPSPDCLVVVRCPDDTYSVYLIELKNIDSPDGFDRRNLREKFLTGATDFMLGYLGAHFRRQDVTFAPLSLYFVSDPYHSARSAAAAQRNRSLERELELSLQPIRYDRLFAFIRLVHPDLTIQPC